MLEREHGFDDAGDPCSGVQMPDIRLDGPDGAIPGPLCRGTKRVRQRLDLDRITDRCPRPVSFDVADAVGGDTGVGEGLHHDFALAVYARRGVTRLLRAVVVDSRALDHGMNRVATRDGIGQPFEHENAAAAAEHRAIGVGIEGSHMTVGRDDATATVHVTGTVRDPHGDRPGHRHIRLVAQEALPGEMDCNQRG